MEGIIYPNNLMTWILEIEVSHSKRIENILKDNNISLVILKNIKKEENLEPILFYLSCNIIQNKLIPLDCCKYIHRVFYCPHSCFDMKQIHFNLEFLSLIQLNSIFKVLAHPKSLEKYIAELLIWDEDEDGIPRNAIVPPSNIHPSRYTHIIQVVYSEQEGLFRWGIVSKEQAIEWNLLTTSLLENIERNENSLDFPPICRAYYKIQEIITHHLPLWKWNLPNYEESYTIDIGSSPGGWTQYLIPYSRHILSVDPGKMNNQLFNLKNKENEICMKYIPYLAESLECRKEIIQLTCEPFNQNNLQIEREDEEENLSTLKLFRVISPLTICVCDVNFEPHLAAEMITNCILPFMKLNEIVTEQLTQNITLNHTKYRFQSSTNNSNINLQINQQRQLKLEIEQQQEEVEEEENNSDFYSYIILTLKLQKNPSERIIQKSFNNVQNIILKGLETKEEEKYQYNCEFKMIYLNANSKNERTVVCRFQRSLKIKEEK